MKDGSIVIISSIVGEEVGDVLSVGLNVCVGDMVGIDVVDGWVVGDHVFFCFPWRSVDLRDFEYTAIIGRNCISINRNIVKDLILSFVE